MNQTTMKTLFDKVAKGMGINLEENFNNDNDEEEQADRPEKENNK